MLLLPSSLALIHSTVGARKCNASHFSSPHREPFGGRRRACSSIRWRFWSTMSGNNKVLHTLVLAYMYPQMVYHADVRAREMELAADRQMGCSCSPLGRMISRMITKCNGRERRVRRYNDKMDYAMAYAPAQTCYVRPTARTVTLATSNSHAHAHAHAVQPEPPQAHATATTLPGTPFPSTGAPPQGARKPRKKKKKRVRFTPSGPVPADDDDQPPPHHAQHHAATVASGGAAGGTAGVVYHHHGGAEPPTYHPSPAHQPPAHGGHGYAYGYGWYAPSPLPRWETQAGTPRRHEYFSGEYRWYYPTPVREGIYSIATDANGRLSTIFSEENPNACSIV
ncbi:uncharacterized protein LOC120703235 isoform X1 [Panicum virgatum]|uniref:uncharacterized protein LOC120703235 isoform X1 n=1 Tax=Panicum virgatum TaxID=38727 RepID=UPI0019D6347B|nr:uncharacterized protein LOC120703235 isoform X1 [Panicum virgatum]